VFELYKVFSSTKKKKKINYTLPISLISFFPLSPTNGIPMMVNGGRIEVKLRRVPATMAGREQEETRGAESGEPQLAEALKASSPQPSPVGLIL